MNSKKAVLEKMFILAVKNHQQNDFLIRRNSPK